MIFAVIAVVARASDKVQVMGAVGAMQATRHDKQNGTGSIAKNARTGHPRFRNGKEKAGKGRAISPTE
jgi:hypothetical protein